MTYFLYWETQTCEHSYNNEHNYNNVQLIDRGKQRKSGVKLEERKAEIIKVLPYSPQ